MREEERFRAQADRVNGTVTRLTPREQQVLQQVVAGKKTREIAEQLGLSARTVEVHRSHLRMKLGARSVADLVNAAISNEICAVRPPQRIPAARRGETTP